MLNSKCRMVELGPCTYYLGMTVTRNRQQRQIQLSQPAYLERVLREHSMWECKKVVVPMDTHLSVAETGYEATNTFRTQYQSAVGSLMYVMLGTQPDIAYSVSVVSRYASNPDPGHWQVVSYLRGTISLKLTYKGNLQPLTGYTDADWAGDRDTRRSTFGFVFNIGSGAVSWSSKLQLTVALSTCEAEYMGQTQATKEAVWLKSLLNEIERPISTPVAPSIHSMQAVIINCDNQGAAALAKNPLAHARSKHIDIQWHYQREKIEDGSVQLRYIPTDQQIADGLTKPLPKNKFLSFRNALGLE